MNLFFRWALRLGWLCTAPVAMCRVVTATLWISGGSEGIVYGGEKLPGWLGIMSHIQEAGPEDCWLEVGGTRDWAELAAVGNARLPDAVVPSEFLLQRFGQELFQQDVPWTLSNVKILPQFPQAEVPAPASREWKHPDGFSIHIKGLLAEKAPLRIPPSQLRPLWVTNPVDHLQEVWIKDPPPVGEFQVVVLPEQSDVKEMSRQLPEATILVEPAGGRPQVVELDGGARLRVRPGEFGRALIRVEVKWDTVRKEFLHPGAEVIWVREPDLETFELTPQLVERVRPQHNRVGHTDSAPDTAYQCVRELDLVSLTFAPVFQDAWQLHVQGRDQVVMRIPLTRAEAAELVKLDPPFLLPGTQPELRITADWAAGNGGDEWRSVRNFLDQLPGRPVLFETRWEQELP